MFYWCCEVSKLCIGWTGRQWPKIHKTVYSMHSRSEVADVWGTSEDAVRCWVGLMETS